MKAFKCFTCDSKFSKSDGLLDHLKSCCIEEKINKNSIRKTTNKLDSSLSEIVSGIKNQDPKINMLEFDEKSAPEIHTALKSTITPEMSKLSKPIMTPEFDKQTTFEIFNESEQTMTLEFDEISQYALESTIVPELDVELAPETSKSSDSITTPEFFEVSLPLEPLDGDAMVIVDQEDNEVTFNNIKPETPILFINKRMRQESESSDPLFCPVRFF